MEFDWLTIVILTAAGLSLVHAALMTLHDWEHRRFAASRFRRGVDVANAQMHVAVIAPCKGLDVDLEENLRRLFEQDYPHYELIFTFEDSGDPACSLVRRLVAEHPHVTSHIVIAGLATSEGQKVHNLLAATADLPERIQVLAFVDSDAGPSRDWISALVTRLDHHGVTAVTSYRWFVPKQPSLVNHLLTSINGVVASLFGPGGFHLVWGGSWAIRRSDFESLGIREHWQGTLSDDMMASRVLRNAGKAIDFEPMAVVASPLDMDLVTMFKFLRRQYMIGRHYAPLWWGAALAIASINVVAFWGLAAVTLYAAITGSGIAWIAGAGLLAIYAYHVLRGWIRGQMSRLYVRDRDTELDPSRRLDLWGGPLIGLLNWIGIAMSAWGTTMNWRGIQYKLGRHGHVVSVSRITTGSELHNARQPARNQREQKAA